MDRPERSLQEEIRGPREAARQDALGLLGGLPLTGVQRERLSDLGPQPSLVGSDAELTARYLEWWQRLDGLVRNIEATPVQALSDAERDALAKAVSIARLETKILQSRLPPPSPSFAALAEAALRPRVVTDDNAPSRKLDWQ